MESIVYITFHVGNKQVTMMQVNEEKIKAEEAQQALNSIESLQRSGMQRAITPHWYSITLAIIVGVLVFVIAAALRNFYVIPILALPLIISLNYRQADASMRTLPTNKVALFVFVTIMLILISVGRILDEIYHASWAPILVGLIAGVIAYLLAAYERKNQLNKANNLGEE